MTIVATMGSRSMGSNKLSFLLGGVAVVLILAVGGFFVVRRASVS